MRTRSIVWMSAIVASLAWPALAGPPYVTDDAEPTETGHFENYLFTEGTRVDGAFSGPATGVEINYGAFEDTQVSLSLPFNPNPGAGGMGVVWAPLGGGVKYRLIFFPVGSATHTSPTTELFPIWIQKSWGPWTTFGGGGYTNNPGSGNRDFANYGWAITRHLTDNLQLGVELFGLSRDSASDRAGTAAGFGWVYDFSEQWHLVGSLNAAVHNPQADGFSFNIAAKWTI